MMFVHIIIHVYHVTSDTDFGQVIFYLYKDVSRLYSFEKIKDPLVLFYVLLDPF